VWRCDQQRPPGPGGGGLLGEELAATAAKSSGWLKAEKFFDISGKAIKWAEVVIKIRYR
jgi:hypothetical protein